MLLAHASMSFVNPLMSSSMSSRRFSEVDGTAPVGRKWPNRLAVLPGRRIETLNYNSPTGRAAAVASHLASHLALQTRILRAPDVLCNDSAPPSLRRS